MNSVAHFLWHGSKALAGVWKYTKNQEHLFAFCKHKKFELRLRAK